MRCSFAVVWPAVVVTAIGLLHGRVASAGDADEEEVCGLGRGG